MFASIFNKSTQSIAQDDISFARILKFNPHHDGKGRFSAGDSSSLGKALLNMAGGEEHPNIIHMKVGEGKPFGGDHNKGISRIDMPQIPRADREQFLANLGANVTPESVDPMTLKPTQNELDGAKVGRLYKKMVAGERHPDPILVSQEGYVIDGHHHWGAAVAAKATGLNPHEKIPIYRIHMEHGALMEATRAYAKEKGYMSKDITKAEFSFSHVLKHNPYHDQIGRFTNHGGAHFMSLWGKGYAQAFQAKNPPAKAPPTKEQAKAYINDMGPVVDQVISALNNHYDSQSYADTKDVPLTADEQKSKALIEEFATHLSIANGSTVTTGQVGNIYGMNSIAKAKMGMQLGDHDKENLGMVEPVMDPKQRAKDQYKKDQNALQAAVIKATEDFGAQGPHGHYMDPPTPAEQGVQNAFKNLVNSHMEVYPHDMKDMAELELSQMADMPYQVKYKLGLPLMQHEKEQVAKDLKDLMIPKGSIGGGWTTPTDLGEAGKSKLEKPLEAAISAAGTNMGDLWTAGQKVYNANMYNSTEAMIGVPITEQEQDLKDAYDKSIALAHAAHPDHKEQMSATISQWATQAGVPTIIKEKLGMHLTDDEQSKVNNQKKNVNETIKYNALVKYQAALEAKHMATLTNNKEAYAVAAADAKTHLASAQAVGVTEDSLAQANELAKGNAEYNLKQKQTEAESDYTKTYQQHLKAQREGTPMDPSVLEQNKQFWMEKGLLDQAALDRIHSGEESKVGSLKNFHKQLKQQLPEATKLSDSFNGKNFSPVQPYESAAEEVFAHGKRVYDSLPGPVRSTVKDYTSSGYKTNKKVGLAATSKMLGGDAKLDSETKAYVARMDEATSQPIGKDLVLARNFPTKFMFEQMGTTQEEVSTMSQDELNKKFVGKLYRDTTFGSTSVNTNFSGSYSSASSQGQGKFMIRAPADTKGIAVEKFTNNTGEHEVILARGTTYLIRSVKYDQYNGTHFEVDIVGQFPDKLD